jgi:hypothetical protein
MDNATADFGGEAGKNSAGWHRRLKLFLAFFVVLAVLVGAVQLYAYLTYRPQLVYPPGYEAALRAMPKVDPQLVDYYVKLYGLDTKPCTVGKKYGALCQDGKISLFGSADACKDDGGVKEWVECR